MAVLRLGSGRLKDPAVDAHWPEAGARLHHSVGAWPLVIDDSSRVTAIEPGRSLELVARGWPIREAKVLITVEDLELKAGSPSPRTPSADPAN